jgi:cytochrome c5
VRSLTRLALVALLACCGRSRAEDTKAIVPALDDRRPATNDAQIDRGRALVARFECNRCHDGLASGSAPLDKHCVHCHARIARGEIDAPRAAIAAWQRHVAPLTALPSLTSIGARFERRWIEEYLVDPYDLRPRLAPTMPRLAITRSEASDIAAYLAPDGDGVDAGAPRGDASEGRVVLDTHGCGSCHTFGGVAPLRASPLPIALEAKEFANAATLAPDLRFTRDRYRRAALVRWLLSPSSIKADAMMPAIPLSESEARDAAAYLLDARLAPAPTIAMPPRLPLLARRVTFDEVNARVFKKSCWHCHSDPDLAKGDGGPGNTGGFGFPPRGLSLADYGGVAAGALGDDGIRRSVFAPSADGIPRLVAALLARQVEEATAGARMVYDGPRGMPLGLPPLRPDEIQLVETWVAQGRRR